MGLKHVLLFIHFFACPLAFATSSDWILSDMEDSKVWLHKKNSNITGSLQTLTRDEPLDWSKIDKRKFYQELEASKKRSLSIVGVKDWKASQYKFETLDGNERLVIEGSYIDSAGVEVVFKEVHVFRLKETVQLLHTRPKEFAQNTTFEDDFFNFALPGSVKK